MRVVFFACKARSGHHLAFLVFFLFKNVISLFAVVTAMPREHKLKPVTSGLAFDAVALGETPSATSSTVGASSVPSAFVTSHSARVLLAGAGFLADAV